MRLIRITNYFIFRRMSFSEFSIQLNIILNYICDFFMISFCFFSLIILVYYIRRRYHLYLEMKAITVEQLWFLSFQNHLKNLKIKALVANFVITILLVEIGTRVCFIVRNRCEITALFKLKFSCPNFDFIHYACYSLELVTQNAYIPLVCLFVKVLWLVYLHSPYKYSVMKWIAYIVMKITTYQTYTLISPIISDMYGYSENAVEKRELTLIGYALQWFFMLYEYIYYLKYSRRFYLLLKGIELENKLSLDRKKYLDCKFIRIHFKVGTILVAIAFLFRVIYTIPVSYLFAVQHLIELFMNDQLTPVLQKAAFENSFFLMLYRIVSNLNYLYMFIIIVLQYLKKKHNNRNINDKIRPLVRAYQNKIFTSRVNYTRC